MRKKAWSISALLILVMMQSAIAAKRLGPPVEDLRSDPARTRIVIAVASEKTQSTSILFSISERLSGESPDKLLLRIDKETFADVVIGRSYLVAWSDLRRSRRVVSGWEKDPDGPYIVKLPGLGSAALFENSPQMRFLFAGGTNVKPDASSHQINALLEQMQRQDFRSRGLVIMELYLRPNLAKQMNLPQAKVLKVILQSLELDPQQRDFLLRAALGVPQELSSPWLGEAFRKIIIEHGTQYDLGSFVPGLVRTAARGLQQTGGPDDIELLSMLLYSNNPGVAKATLATMDHFDPEATVVKAQQALGRGWIHEETRRVLKRYLGQPFKS